MSTGWAERSTLTASEIETLTALDFDSPDPRTVAAGAGTDRPPRDRLDEWLGAAYPHLEAADRRVRAAIVAAFTVAVIVAVTVLLYGLTTQPALSP